MYVCVGECMHMSVCYLSCCNFCLTSFCSYTAFIFYHIHPIDIHFEPTLYFDQLYTQPRPTLLTHFYTNLLVCMVL